MIVLLTDKQMTEKLKHAVSQSIYSRVINFDSKLPKWNYQWEIKKKEEEKEEEE